MEKRFGMVAREIGLEKKLEMSDLTGQFDYDKIALRLDGQKVELSAAEFEVYQQILQDEQQILPKLSVEMPAAAAKRASRRMSAAAASHSNRSHKLLYIASLGGAVAAAAAVVIITMSAIWQPVVTPGTTHEFLPEQVIVDAMDPYSQDSDVDMRLDNVARQLNSEQAGFMMDDDTASAEGIYDDGQNDYWDLGGQDEEWIELEKPTSTSTGGKSAV